MSKESVLQILKDNPGKCVSGGKISRACNISRTAVWKTVQSLNKDGYIIATRKNAGYIFLSTNDMLSAADIKSSLRSTVLGTPLEILKTVDSTNNYLKSKEGLKDGHFVIADEQTGGRGRLGRRFFSPNKKGIYMSLYLTPDIPVSDVGLITILAAISVTLAVEAVCGVSPSIKWVNDVLLGGKKICGILTEASIEAESGVFKHIILGIGINIWTDDFPKEIADIAGCVSEKSSIEFSRNTLIAEIINIFEPFYLKIEDPLIKQEIIDIYRSKLCMLNGDIMVIRGADQYAATALDIDSDGHLIVKDNEGTIKTLSSGEISIRSITNEE